MLTANSPHLRTLPPDPYQSAQGVISLRAFRMTKVFSQLLKTAEGFSPEKYVWSPSFFHFMCQCSVFFL